MTNDDFLVFAVVGGSFQQVGGSCPSGHIMMKGLRPDGEYIASNSGDWIPKPPPSNDDLIRDAIIKKNKALAFAKEKISIWQTELQLGMISDSDKEKLIRWVQYIKKLNDINISDSILMNSEHRIEFPQVPN